MARVYTQRTRKERVCGKCGDKIPPGTQYRSFAPGFRSRPHTRCMKSTCTPRQSELTTSKLSSVYAAMELAEDAINGEGFDPVDYQSYLDEVAQALRDVADEYREASEAWASGSGNPEMDEKADTLESSADELESWQPDHLEWDEDAQEMFETKEDWRDDFRDSLSGAIGDVELP